MTKLIRKLKPKKIRGKKVEFERRKDFGFAPSGYVGGEYVQAYINNRPYSAGKTKTEAEKKVRRNMRIEKNYGSMKRRRKK